MNWTKFNEKIVTGSDQIGMAGKPENTLGGEGGRIVRLLHTAICVRLSLLSFSAFPPRADLYTGI